jgi:hypothetical protein
MREHFSFSTPFEFVRFKHPSSATLLNFSQIVSEHVDLWNIVILSVVCLPVNYIDVLRQVEQQVTEPQSNE